MSKWPTECERCGMGFNIDYVKAPPDKVNPEDHPFTAQYCPYCGGEL